MVCGLCASVRISFGNALVAYSANNTDVTDYGGYDSFNGSDPELLECMIDVGDPTGYMTAEDVLYAVDNI